MIPSDSYTALQNLRARAERRRLSAATLPAEAPADVQRLVQELQVHQVELEMQYEELLVAQTEAASSYAQYLDLYDFAPVGYCTLAADGTMEQLNLQTAQLLGAPREQLQGRRLSLFVPLPERTQLAEFLAQLEAAPGQRFSCELAMHRRDESPFVAQVDGVATTPAPGQDLTYRLVLLDVTASRAARDELARSEARFRATFEQSRDGMLLLDQHHFVDVNDAALWMMRRTHRHQVVGHHVAEFWPEYQPGGRRSMDMLSDCLARARTEGWCRLEWVRYDSAGQIAWDEIAFSPILVNGQSLVHGTWRDITDLKRMQQAKLDQQQQLAQAVLATEEGEKHRIAESLHNGLAQLLYAAKLSLEQLEAEQCQQDPKAFTRAQLKVASLLASAITQTRTLAHELVPRTLEDFGLEAAIQDICTDYSLSPLRLTCHLPDLPAGLPSHLALALYRMAQELANNIVKHAHATQAKLSIIADDQTIELRAEDNGVGFAANSQSKGLGWQALQDRVRLLNGTLHLATQPGHTCVTIALPLPS
ncbi:PAS domain S-box protein [Hymenobacter setariae]|uniref:PAS domain S-box protein n=1 Tax=Hymenobacter setariae TaxID=2594794 RepID=A0A558BVU8_9BACT|nr:PAS domain-containing protein [Hymenobacter setariae]TVT40611.1 PAS domain S-box protein [Hymenobacter setariae]